MLGWKCQIFYGGYVEGSGVVHPGTELEFTCLIIKWKIRYFYSAKDVEYHWVEPHVGAIEEESDTAPIASPSTAKVILLVFATRK